MHKKLQKGVPNVIGLGFAKCGTSTISRVLAEHPEVCLSSIKETNLFSYVVPDEYIDFYLSLFKHYNRERHKIVMEWSNEYIRNISNMENIKRFLGDDITFLLSYRNPFDHFRSLYFYYIMTDPYGDCRHNCQRAILDKYHRRNPWFFYDTCFERFRKVFPDSRVLVINFEDFTKNIKMSFNQLFSHLGISSFESYSTKRHNCTIAPKNIFIDKWLRRFLLVFYQGKKGKVLYRADWRYKPYWLRKIQKLNQLEMVLDDNAREFIEDKFLPRYVRFEEIVKNDPNVIVIPDRR